jgi:hypothetical protein
MVASRCLQVKVDASILLFAGVCYIWGMHKQCNSHQSGVDHSSDFLKYFVHGT